MTIGISASTATWGDFNSLVQLSVGLNAAFATFSDFLGDGLPREEKRINRLITILERQLTNKSTPDRNSVSADRRDLHLLLGRCTANKVNHERFRSGFVRIGGFICASLGVVTLVYASYNAGTQILIAGQLIVLLLLTPFAFGAGHGMYISIRSYFDISKERQSIEEKINTRRKIANSKDQELKVSNDSALGVSDASS